MLLGGRTAAVTLSACIFIYSCLYSYIVKPGQKITLKEKSKKIKIVSHCLETLTNNKVDYVVL
ncbi:MAG: hypothetical protein Q8839_02650, partial [Candidatus Phytoplasma australasiaticum]|nr:hypothetical protein [Candidatus Phytoplasma australasiaticum]